MTGVVLGKPNFEALSAAEFTKLLNALISAGYVSLDTLRPQINAFFKSDLTNSPRTPEEDAQVDPDIVGDHFYDLFQTITFRTVDEVVTHYQTYQNRSLPFATDLYDWSTIEGDYGYKLAHRPGGPLEILYKDLALFLELAGRTDVLVPLAEGARGVDVGRLVGQP